MPQVHIYGLICPISKEIKYIGKTSLKLSRRLGLHTNKDAKNSSKKSKWIDELRQNLMKPEILLLETTSPKMASYIERQWITRMGISNLYNGNVGGGGSNCEGTKRGNTYISRFTGYLIESGYSKRSIHNYHCYLIKFITRFKGIEDSPKEINSTQITNYIKSIENKNTRNIHIVALKLFYKAIMKQPFKLKDIKYEYS